MRSILKSSGNMERMDEGKLTKKYSEGVGGGQRERVKALLNLGCGGFWTRCCWRVGGHQTSSPTEL